MLRTLFISIVACLYCCTTFGQRDPSTASGYMESIGEGKYNFYFDQQYYLNAKDCQYVYIVRTSAYNLDLQQFEGRFEDFDMWGRAVLEGQYENGKRNGIFTAYHTNGQKKWSGTYEDDMPMGTWHYFYPDGKPMINLRFQENGVYIQDYFNTKGQAKVKDGHGKYEMKIEVDTYNDYGAIYIHKKGNIREGKPSGRWEIGLVYEDGKKDYLSLDTYRNGRIVLGDNLEIEMNRFGLARTSYLPMDWSLNADHLSFKNCNIDEQSGFLRYLAERLDRRFEGIVLPESEQQWIEYQVVVDQHGNSKNVVSHEKHQDVNMERILRSALQNVPYWIPSYLDGEFIEDVLTVKMLVGFDASLGSMQLYDLQIEREKGL